MITITIIGAGNVAQHLIQAFAKSEDLSVVQVYSRQKNKTLVLPELVKITNDLNDLIASDVYIIAVSDHAIAQVASELPFKNRLVVHTSGSVALDALNNDNRKGVFYPLQTFTKNKSIDFSSVPICLETQFGADYQLLEQVAKAVSNSVFAINSEQRKALHVAAVFVNNFVNELYRIGSKICEENQIPFEILKPLIKETAEKIMSLSPNEAQTGPAKRVDLKTISAHLDFISDGNQRTIYEVLTQSILQNAKNL
jgi:predicted short-subunit dehydrogenase-like oxidoreductase (DUF2520 family)